MFSREYGVWSFHTANQQDRSCSETVRDRHFIFPLPVAGRLFETDRSSQATDDEVPFFPPCWRHQHLTLHTTNCDVPTAFELPTPWAPLWNVTKKNNILLLQDFFSFFFSSPPSAFNKRTGPDREKTWRIRRRRRLCMSATMLRLANKSSGLHHSLSPRRSFVLNLLSPSFSNLAQGCWWLAIRAALLFDICYCSKPQYYFSQCACVSRTCRICFPFFFCLKHNCHVLLFYFIFILVSFLLLFFSSPFIHFWFDLISFCWRSPSALSRRNLFGTSYNGKITFHQFGKLPHIDK